MRESKKKSSNKPIAQQPEHLDPIVQNNPNRYYYTGTANITAIFGSEHSPSQAAVILRTSEPLQGQAWIERDAVFYPLTPISTTFWVGYIPISPPNTPIWVRMDTEQKIFYKAFTLPSSNTTALSLPETGTQNRVPYDHNTSETFSVPYQTIDYTGQNFFQPERWISSVSANMTVKGVKTVSIRNKFIRGVKDGFTPGTERDELLRLTAQGKVNDIEVNATIQDSSTVLDDTNKNSIELKSKDWELYFGEYWANLNQTELMAFNKRLDGVKGLYRFGPFQVTAMVSESKGQAGFDQLYGFNSQGPYALGNRPLILYSEKVKYHGQLLVRDIDYSIDYELGKITFLKFVIPNTDLFTVDYEYSDTTFKRTFTAGYLEYNQPKTEVRSTPNALSIAHIGVSFQSLNDRGSAQVSNNQTLIAPKSNYALGVDSVYTYDTWLKGQTQVAGSYITQTAVNNPTSNLGLAVKQGFEISTQEFQLKGSVKKLSSSYRSIGNAYLNPGFFSYDIFTHYTPSAFGTHTLQTGQENYPKADGKVAAQYVDYKTSFGALSYGYYKRQDQDLSSKANPFDKTIERNSGALTTQLGMFEMKPGYQVERNTDTYSPTNSYTAESIKLDSRIIGLENIQIGSSLELQNQKRATGLLSHRNSAGINTQIAWGSDYSVDAIASAVDDSQAGKSALAVMNYSLRPLRNLKLNGNYSLETIEETLGTASYRVMNHQGNFQFNFRPIHTLSLGYKFKPTFSEILGSKIRYEDRLVNQYTIGQDLTDFWTLGLDYKTTDKFLLDKNQLPQQIPSQVGNERILLFQSDTQLSNQDTIRYVIENSLSSQKSSQTKTTSSNYETVLSQSFQQSVEFTQQITETIKLASAYRFSHSINEQVIATASNTDTVSHTAEASCEWNPTGWLNLKLTESGVQNLDLKRIVPDTYLIGSRVDFRIRAGQNWSIGGFGELTQSFLGQATFHKRGSFNLRYDSSLFQVLNLTLSAQVDYDGETAPANYDTYDTLLKLTLTF
ncbi:MAG: hypothetical protein AB7F28_08630 [Candidatus Margulisiibacteriota bacterium]